MWQCPVCYKALPHTELRVDRHMKEILEKVMRVLRNEDVYAVLTVVLLYRLARTMTR